MSRKNDCDIGIQTVAKYAPVSIMCFDGDGVITYVNDWHLKSFSKNRRDKSFFLGKDIKTLPGIVSSGLKDKIEELLNGKGLYLKNIFTPEFSGGQAGYQNVKGIPIHEKGDFVGGVILREICNEDFIEDIKNIENAKVIEALLNATNDSVILIDLDGTFLALNTEAANRRNMCVADLVGKNLFDHLHPVVAVTRRKQINKVIISKTPLFYEESVGDKTYYVSVYPVMNDDGEVVHIASYSRDRTEQKKYELELIEAREMAESANLVKTQFLANMSHELRTPLNGILGISQLLLQNESQGETSEGIEMIYSCGKKLLAVINNLLDLADIEKRAIEPVLTQFDLHKLIDSLQKSFTVQTVLKGLRFLVEKQEGLPALFVGDEYRLRQILSNLITNAVQGTEKGFVRLDVSFEEAGCHLDRAQTADLIRVVFTVSDSGVGIGEKEIESIFDTFTIAESYLTKKRSGAGIGLSIVKSLVSIMGGTISVNSSVGAGTVATVSVPLAKLATPDDSPGEPETEDVAKFKLNVLVAEDDYANRVLVSRYLKSLGCTVFEAVNGLEVLDVFRDNPIDLILMDIQMPVMNGLQAAGHIRNGELPGVDRNIPIIALTAYATDKDRERFVGSGMNGVIAKPFDLRHLKEEILAHAGKRR